jgi:hypothetical protein
MSKDISDNIDFDEMMNIVTADNFNPNYNILDDNVCDTIERVAYYSLLDDDTMEDSEVEVDSDDEVEEEVEVEEVEEEVEVDESITYNQNILDTINLLTISYNIDTMSPQYIIRILLEELYELFPLIPTDNLMIHLMHYFTRENMDECVNALITMDALLSENSGEQVEMIQVDADGNEIGNSISLNSFITDQLNNSINTPSDATYNFFNSIMNLSNNINIPLNFTMQLATNVARQNVANDHLTPEQIASLCTVQYKNLDITVMEKHTNCAICSEDYELDHIVTCLQCDHIFHNDCIAPWLRTYNNSCPLCKEKID